MIEVGQTVILVPYGNNARRNLEPREAPVVKVGRKYFYIQAYEWDVVAFELADNRQKNTGYGYGADWSLYPSWEAYREKMEHNRLTSVMRERFYSLGEHGLTLDKLRRIEAILNED